MPDTYGFDAGSVRRIAEAVKRVESMHQPTGKRLQAGDDGGGVGTSVAVFRVTGAATTGYYPAVKKTWSAGVISETGSYWLFHWAGRELDNDGVYMANLVASSFTVGGSARAVYGVASPRATCVNGQPDLLWD